MIYNTHSLLQIPKTYPVILGPPVNACQCFDHPTADKSREMPQSFNKRAPVVLSFSKEDGSLTPKELRSRKCHAPVANGIDFIIIDNLAHLSQIFRLNTR